MSVQAKTDLLPMELVQDVNLALSELIGCLSPAGRLPQLSRSLARAAARLGEKDPGAFCQRIIERDLCTEDLEELAAALLPGETYFFRDRPGMEALQNELLPRLIRERSAQRKLSLWSAGCSTGEEPLTLAMMLHASLERLAGWSIKILATDLRERALEAAKLGVYRDWSFRDCPGWVKERFFEPQPLGGWRILPELLALLEYRPLNLVREPLPRPNPPDGGFDLILCRNVLIYLDPRKIPPLLQQIHNCLAEDGWLLVAPAEAQAVSLDWFENIRIGETMFFRKRKHSGPQPVTGAANVNHQSSTMQENPAAQPASRGLPPSRRRETGGQCGPQNQDAQSQWAQADCCLEQGDFAAARDALRRALYLDRGCAMAHLLQGHLRRAEGEPAKARRSYQIALRLLERLAPDCEVDKLHHRSAGELIAVLRETLDGLK